ncbi:MAG TPA: DEAD/DEAH box helicase [Terriglobales bacterium]|nr:DEAD/DEAH box helicase [Terriglobales bacterium]
MHRIYLVNVLGFEPTSEPHGYVMAGVPNAETLIELIEYLDEQGAHPIINDSLEGVIEEFRGASADLTAARQAGQAVKSTPPDFIKVPNFKRKLKPYQIPAVAHAVAVGNAANFSVPGSGKTSIALAAFAIFHQRNEADKLVIIGPRSSFAPWEEEFQACFLRKPQSIRISGNRARRMKLYREATDAELILLTYQMATGDHDKLRAFLRQNICLVVLDESHNIKRLEGGTWAPTLIDIGTYARKRMILTGTPAPNSVVDLWSQMTFLWPNPPILGTRDQFKMQVKEDESRSLPEIRQELFPFYWRIRKKDLHLPPARFRSIELDLRPYQRAIYMVLAAKVLSEVVKVPTERARLRMWRTARMVRLLQAASNPALLTRYSTEFQVPPLSASGLSVDELIRDYHKFETPAKIDFTIKLVRSLVKKKQKVLVWTAFVHNIRTLEESLRDLRPRVVYGDIPKDISEDIEFNREKMIQEFKTDPEYPILIANPSACAESVSLHRVCNHAIYVDRTFNAAHYMQSLDRIHRVGMSQNQRVQYYLLQSRDTIDEVIHERLLEKERRMRTLLDDDISVMNLDYEEADFSEESEEDRDFSTLVEHLRKTSKNMRND